MAFICFECFLNLNKIVISENIQTNDNCEICCKCKKVQNIIIYDETIENE